MNKGFLAKTFDIFSSPLYSECCCWGPDGETIIITQIDKFSNEVLPNYFKHSNFQSFVRQLNMYDFHKTMQEREFKHPCFRKGHPELLPLIHRKAYTHKSTAGASKKQSEAVPSLQVKTDVPDKELLNAHANKGASALPLSTCSTLTMGSNVNIEDLLDDPWKSGVNVGNNALVAMSSGGSNIISENGQLNISVLAQDHTRLINENKILKKTVLDSRNRLFDMQKKMDNVANLMVEMYNSKRDKDKKVSREQLQSNDVIIEESDQSVGTIPFQQLISFISMDSRDGFNGGINNNMTVGEDPSASGDPLASLSSFQSNPGIISGGPLFRNVSWSSVVNQDPSNPYPSAGSITASGMNNPGIDISEMPSSYNPADTSNAGDGLGTKLSKRSSIGAGSGGSIPFQRMASSFDEAVSKITSPTKSRSLYIRPSNMADNQDNISKKRRIERVVSGGMPPSGHPYLSSNSTSTYPPPINTSATSGSTTALRGNSPVTLASDFKPGSLVGAPLTKHADASPVTRLDSLESALSSFLNCLDDTSPTAASTSTTDPLEKVS